MHLSRWFGAASACALVIASATAFAQAARPASGAAASIDDASDEAAILASARWRDFASALRDTALLGPANEPGLRSACHDALAKARPAGVSAADACIAAALADFDPRATYYSASETAKFKSETAGNWVGIGLEIGRNAGQGPLVVVRPIVGAPGERAGILAGDLIVRIAGQDVAPLTLPQAVALMRGPVGSELQLDIERGPSHAKVTISAVRDRIQLDTVRHEAPTPQAATMRITQFDRGTLEQLSKRISDILRAQPRPPDALVLDLRANPGGLLETVIQVGGAFSTDDTPVVHQRSRTGDVELTAATTKAPHFAFPAAERAWLNHVRIAVLVDERTASGAEALALFLREQRGARIVGQRTLGTAVVRLVAPLGGEAMMHIPVSELRSSRKLAWDRTGVQPDVVLAGAAPGARSPEFGADDDHAFWTAVHSLELP